MNEEVKKELYRAAVTIFEELCFMFHAPELEEQQKEAEFEAAVSVEFQGPLRGKLVVKAYGGLLNALAANMLGEDEVASEEQQYDALGEIANVICGNVLPGLAGSKAVFHLDAPQKAEDVDSQGNHAESPAGEVRVVLDQGRADVMIYTNGKQTPYEE